MRWATRAHAETRFWSPGTRSRAFGHQVSFDPRGRFLGHRGHPSSLCRFKLINQDFNKNRRPTTSSPAPRAPPTSPGLRPPAKRWNRLPRVVCSARRAWCAPGGRDVGWTTPPGGVGPKNAGLVSGRALDATALAHEAKPKIRRRGALAGAHGYPKPCGSQARTLLGLRWLPRSRSQNRLKMGFFDAKSGRRATKVAAELAPLRDPTKSTLEQLRVLEGHPAHRELRWPRSPRLGGGGPNFDLGRRGHRRSSTAT